MLAARLNELNQPLRVEEVSELTLSPGVAIVRLHAAALNRRDYWITQGQYPAIQLPAVLGSDGAGTVIAVADPLDAAWVDQKVIINPGLDWGTATTHQSRGFHILGMPTPGTFAQQVVIPVSQLYPKPEHLDWHQAAALPLAGLTAYRALFTQGNLIEGQSVLVTGIGGGVASHALQFAVAIGALVAVTSSNRAKLESATSQGATHAFNYTDSAWVNQARRACGGFDLIIDGSGGSQYGNLLSLANPGGCIVNYGATAGAPESLDMFKLFWNQLRLVGSTMGSPGDFTAMLSLVSAHQLVPLIDRVYPLAEVNEALDRMGRSDQCGKLVLQI